MENLKKLLKNQIITTFFWCVCVLGALWIIFWLCNYDISNIWTKNYKLFGDSSYGYKNYALLLYSFVMTPLGLFYVIYHIKELFKFFLDYKNPKIIENTLKVVRVSSPKNLEKIEKKSQYLTYFEIYGYNEYGKKIVLKVFPEIFSYNPNIKNKTFHVSYYRYSKTVIEISKNKLLGDG